MPLEDFEPPTIQLLRWLLYHLSYKGEQNRTGEEEFPARLLSVLLLQPRLCQAVAVSLVIGALLGLL